MSWHLARDHPFAAVRMLTFDLDDTLWPRFPTIHAAECEVHAWLQKEAPVLAEHYDIERLREHRMLVARDNPHMAHDLTAIRIHSYRELARSHGFPEAVAQEANAIFRRAHNRVTPYEEVREVLGQLAARYVLVAVSNGNAQIEKTPLAGCFHYSFMAEEVGRPSPIRRCSMPPARRPACPCTRRRMWVTILHAMWRPRAWPACAVCGSIARVPRGHASCLCPICRFPTCTGCAIP